MILLLGGGMLGRDLMATAPDAASVTALDHAALDVTNTEAMARALDTHHPSLVINTAAFTRVDDAERERDRAFQVNANAPGALGRLCADRATRVVHFSTDYVFSGNATRPYREDDEPSPVNVYGESKLAGERALAESGARALIIRTQWLYGATGTSFPATMLARARTRTPTRVVNDQTGRPTSTRSLARAVWQLIGLEAAGTVHVADAGAATWFEVAERIFASVGARDVLSACTTDEFPARARRPRYSVLDTARAASLGAVLPLWTEDLEVWLLER